MRRPPTTRPLLTFWHSVSSKVHTLTQSTVYSTEYETITSCAPEVTDCPAASTVVSSSSFSLSATLVESTATSNSPVGQTGAPSPAGSSKPAVGSTVSVPAPATTGFATSNSPVAATSGAGVCPAYSVKTISTSTTTVIPTVIYETVAVPCATGSSPTGAGGSYPSGIPGNAT